MTFRWVGTRSGSSTAKASRSIAGCQSPRRASRDRAAAFDATTRVATGVPGLDAVTNGGYFLGSTTVVAGISGVGKSVMACQYMAEGARRGERSLMFSLDEQVPQIMRNAKSIGIDLEPWIEQGVVRVHYDPPQEIEIDRHFHEIERIVDEFQPKAWSSIASRPMDRTSHAGTGLPRLLSRAHRADEGHQTRTVYNHENPEMLGCRR